jgi:hypothetical protein
MLYVNKNGIYTLVLDDGTTINNASNDTHYRDYVRNICSTAKDITEMPKEEIEIEEVLDEEIEEAVEEITAEEIAEELKEEVDDGNTNECDT